MTRRSKPSAHGKVPVEHSIAVEDGAHVFTDREGQMHRYQDACAASDVP
jgi:hypothetical protein